MSLADRGERVGRARRRTLHRRVLTATRRPTAGRGSARSPTLAASRLLGLRRRVAPGRIAADAGDAELRGEPQMFGELIAVHRYASIGVRRRLARCRDGSSVSTRSRIAAATRAFACSGSVSAPSAPTMRHCVGVDVEAGVRARDVVGDDQVDVLRSRFAVARADDVARSRRRSRRAAGRCRSPAAAGRGRRGCPASASAPASACRRPSASSARRARPACSRRPRPP